MKHLPTLGLGLGLDMPDAVEACRRRLEGDTFHADLDFINLGFFSHDKVPEELAGLLKQCNWPATLHSLDLNLSDQVELEKLASLRKLCDVLDIQWVVEDLGIWEWNGTYIGSHQLNPMQTPAIIEQTVDNLRKSSKALNRILLTENAPAYFIKGDLNIWDYLLEIAERADCGIALDIGHMIGLFINSGRQPEWPDPDWRGWRRIIEIHLSGFRLYQLRGQLRWIDAHDLPFPDLLLQSAELVIRRSPELRSILLELELAPPEVIATNISQTLHLKQLLNRIPNEQQPTP